jgi:hypothetical protein
MRITRAAVRDLRPRRNSGDQPGDRRPPPSRGTSPSPEVVAARCMGFQSLGFHNETMTNLTAAVARAVKSAGLAYRFAAGSYTAIALWDIHTVQQIVVGGHPDWVAEFAAYQTTGDRAPLVAPDPRRPARPVCDDTIERASAITRARNPRKRSPERPGEPAA